MSVFIEFDVKVICNLVFGGFGYICIVCEFGFNLNMVKNVVYCCIWKYIV